jgi:5-methylthioadenosine/S-adenosylhomocysteine deaminase
VFSAPEATEPAWPLWISGGLLVSPRGAGVDVRRGSLVIRDGRIAEIRPAGDAAPAEARVIDARNKIVIPGLVNAHVHSHGVLTKWVTDTLPLEMWSPFVAAGRATSPEEVRLSALLVAIDCLQSGVTAVLDHALYDTDGIGIAATTYAEVGIRAVIALNVVDIPFVESIPKLGTVPDELAQVLSPMAHADVDTLLEHTATCAERWHGYRGLVSIMVGPSAPLRCSGNLLAGLADIASKRGLGIHTHFLETKGQALMARRRYGQTMSAYLEEYDLLGERTSLAHAVWVDAEDIARIARSGATVVTNPMSNLVLGSGLMPLLEFRDAGVLVALGTDGPNSGGHHSLFETMRLATGLSRVAESDPRAWVGAVDALRSATVNGARALGLRDRIGAIEVGMEADLVLLNQRSVAFTPLNDVVRQLVFCERGQGVDTVLVQGRIVVEAGALRSVDVEGVLAEVEAVTQARREETQRAFSWAQRQTAYTGEVHRHICETAEPRPLWEFVRREGSRR